MSFASSKAKRPLRLLFRWKSHKGKFGAAEEKAEVATFFGAAPKKAKSSWGAFSLPITPSAGSENLHLFAARTFLT